MERSIEDYVNRVGRNMRRLPKHERYAIQREIHQHLVEDTERRVADGATPDDAVQAAITAFGEPSDIALAYDDNVLVNETTGQTVLRLAAATGKAAGRGARGVLKWGGIITASVIGIMLVLTIAVLGLAGTALVVFEDEITEATPRPVYIYSGDWDTAEAHNNVRSDQFSINSEVKEFKVIIDSAPDTGCVSITLTSPSGAESQVNGNGCEDTHYASTFVEKGTWSIRYVFLGYTGSVDVGVFSFEHAN